MGRLSAVSCLSLGPGFARRSALIRNIDSIDTGAHINFTEAMGNDGLYLPLSRLIASCYTRQLNRAAIARQIDAQLSGFEAAMGRAPDFIDGHQHVHQLPQIRDELLLALQRRYPARTPWLRNTLPRDCPQLGIGQRSKAAIIGLLGARALLHQTQRAKLPTNSRLLGVYNFTAFPPYEQQLASWLGRVQHGDVLMCHPARAPTPGDAIGQQRVTEFEALASAHCGQLLQQNRLCITRLSQLFAREPR